MASTDGNPALEAAVDVQALVMKVKAAIASHDLAAAAAMVAEMTVEELRALAVTLAADLAAVQEGAATPPDLGPSGVCSLAIASAAKSFGVSVEEVRGDGRLRAVSDARNVAMAAAYRSGLTLRAIAVEFGKDHTSVRYAAGKIAANDRLEVATQRVLADIEAQYGFKPAPAVAHRRLELGEGAILQMAAFKQTREAVRPEDADGLAAEQVAVAVAAR